jgi:alpha-acetolactate decarboxylase
MVPTRKTYGLLTVESHKAHEQRTGETLHVYLNCHDITSSCYEADDRSGYVKGFCRDDKTHRLYGSDKHFHIGSDGKMCGFHVWGDVRIEPGGPIR